MLIEQLAYIESDRFKKNEPADHYTVLCKLGQ